MSQLPVWRPPGVSTAKGRKTIPLARQATAVSQTFRLQSIARFSVDNVFIKSTPQFETAYEIATLEIWSKK